MPTRLIVLSLALLLLVSARAHAEELRKPTKPEALQHYDAGKVQFKAGDFRAAVNEFQLSLKLEPSAAGYYNTAQCYRTIAKVIDRETSDKREHLQLAIWNFERFLRATTDTPGFAAIAQKLVDESRTAIDGLPKVEPAAAASASVSTTSSSVPSYAERPTAPRTSSRWHDPLGWAITGVGVVGLGAAGLMVLHASSLRDEASGTSTQSQRNDLRDRADRWSLSGKIIGVGSGAILVLGIVKLAIAEDASAGSANTAAATRPHLRPTVGIALSASGVSVVGEF